MLPVLHPWGGEAAPRLVYFPTLYKATWYDGNEPRFNINYGVRTAWWRETICFPRSATDLFYSSSLPTKSI